LPIQLAENQLFKEGNDEAALREYKKTVLQWERRA